MENSPISTEALREQLDSLRAFTVEEFAVQRNGFLRQWSQPLKTRIADGLCIAGLRFERKTTDGHFRFLYKLNDTDFREGDFLRLSAGDPLDPISECVLVAGDPPYITLDIQTRNLNFESFKELYLDASYFDLENMVLEGIDELGTTLRGRERILPLLLGNQVVDAVDQDVFDEAWTESDANHYNNSQSDAIAAGAAAEWCTLIQGPPGSGKTRVLANIVAQRLKRGQRILITAFTHRAIHQALRTIKQILPEEDRIAKIGTIIPDPDLPVPQFEYFAECPLAHMKGGYIAGATVFAPRSKRLKGIEFDVVIIDEASQMTLPNAILAMLTSDAYCIIGDPRQLPPVIQSCAPSEARTHSIFNTLQRNNDLTLLDTTYRMNAAIAAWSSEQFYNGQLQSHPSVAGRRLTLQRPPDQTWLRNTLAPEHPLVWLEHSKNKCRKVCLEEVDLVHQLIAALLHGGLPPGDVAVVTPFRKQARAIRQRLRVATDLDAGVQQQIVVDTVERIQGQEREVILISCAANDPGFVRAVSDFLFLPERLNVAVTRARSKVILLSSDSLLDLDASDSETFEALTVWNNLRASCERIQI